MNETKKSRQFFTPDNYGKEEEFCVIISRSVLARIII